MSAAVPAPSLYVHVPFCASKCGYCAFYSEAADGDTLRRYLRALAREMELVAGLVRPRTIFFGGGTPSMLNPRQWEEILAALARLDLLGAGEWTVECNPATVSLDKARLWRDHGINRLSLGVQSLDEDLLARLGRIHNRSQAFRSYDLLRRAGFDNVNLDLMFAIPGQTLDQWRVTLREALAMDAEHLASYELTYEEDTPLFRELQAGHARVDEDLACSMYDELVTQAAARGFVQYEVSNFARDRRGPEPPMASAGGELPHYACRHNVNYWRGGTYLGLGPSAASYTEGVRTKNWSNTRLYCQALEHGRRPIESRDALPPLARAGEVAAFGLRMNAGWSFTEFREVTGVDLRAEWAAEIERLVACGWGELSAERFHLTRAGLRFADAAGESFLRLPEVATQPGPCPAARPA
jgi:oxygen-independent coproporphyrinogen-3 oxidase